MKIVKDAAWQDKHGVVHVAYWGTSQTVGLRGWFLLCDRRFVGIREWQGPEDSTPTCVRCAAAS